MKITELTSLGGILEVGESSPMVCVESVDRTVCLCCNPKNRHLGGNKYNLSTDSTSSMAAENYNIRMYIGNRIRI